MSKAVTVTDASFEADVELNGAVFQYTVGADGTLTPKSPPQVSVSGHPGSVAVSPDGHSVYVTNEVVTTNNDTFQFTNNVLQFTVGADGTLTPTPGGVATGNGASGIAITGDGESAYVANPGSNTISQYSVGTGGALSPRSPATVPTGSDPSQIAITPTRRVPTSKAQCKNDGWQQFGFKNQGQCIAFVEHGPPTP